MDRPYFREDILSSLKSTYFALCVPSTPREERLATLRALATLGLNYDITAAEVFFPEDIQFLKSYYASGRVHV